MSEESILLSPEEVAKRKQRAVKEDTNLQTPYGEGKYINKGGQVEVRFESQGRFSAPEVMLFKDYTVEHINNLTFCKPENILETLVTIMEDIKNVNEENDVHVADLTLEEFMEALIAIKLQFNTKEHLHRWVCDCQSGISDDSKKINEKIIDLSTLSYRSIEEADSILKEKFKIELDTLTDEQFKEYIKERYKDNPLDNPEIWTKADEIDAVKILEPFHYREPSTKNVYSFRLMRVGDILDAQNKLDSKYASKINMVSKKQTPHGVQLAEFKSKQEKDIEKLKLEQAKETVLMAKALTLIGFNGQAIEGDNEKYNIYKQLSRKSSFELADFLKDIEFGISDERDYDCPICGKTVRRLLQQEFNPIEFLPLDTDTQRVKRESGNINFYFGS